MNVLVTVCARAGSKGVRGKNVRDFLRFPIGYYSLAAYDLFYNRYSAQYGYVLFALNTDSDDLVKQFSRTAVEHVVIPRKAPLAGDRVSKIDVVRDTLAEAETVAGKEFDFIVDIDLTSPLRKAVDIKNVLDTLINSPGADIALSLTGSRRNPYFNQLVRGPNGFLTTAIQSNFIARQQAPEVFDANASLYAYRPFYLKNDSGIFLNAKLVGSMMEDTGILDIDSERDFRLMEIIARFLFETDPAYGEVREHIERIIR
ncbi:MAG: acylneuraminate cytidylyltransferase family protein [Oscillospiraceae bacterium]|nr:acylneuraminate cytidylyltransferase family protein [Oscillospiraceae bacterium]